MALTIGRGRHRHQVQIDVYTRDNCGLCRRAEEQVAEEARWRVKVRHIDIDQDDDLIRRYGLRIPVIVVDGREIAEGELPEGVLRRAIRRSRQHRWAQWRRA